MGATTVFVKPGRLRAHVRRHPWIYGDSIERVEGPYENGDAVVVRAPDGRFVAHAFINDRSRLFLRLVSFDKQEQADEALVRRRVQDAVRLRHEVLGLRARADAYRVIHSEGDGLPGLVVDRYGPVLALTCTSLGTHRRLDPILEELERALQPAAILELPVSDGLRGAEGLPEARGVLRGAMPSEDPVVTVDGLQLRAPLRDGQKTSLYLDQRENVRKVAALCAGRRVLDACTYVGTFAIAAARAGATQVDAFDQSEDAVAMVAENAQRNGVADRVRAVRGRLYDELRDRAARKESWDLVVLDPPKFAAAQKDLQKASKGYFDANLLAMKLVAPGGLLATFSCSHHMEDHALEEILREAATRADIDLRVLDRLSAGPDHPTDLHCPEGRYLKGFIVQRRIDLPPAAPAADGPAPE